MTALSDRPSYATRLNSFKAGRSGKVGIAELLDSAKLAGFDAVDLTFPEHFKNHTPAELAQLLADRNLALNGLTMGFYSYRSWRLGAFTNPDLSIRTDAIDASRKGLDALVEMGGNLITLWMGQDGVDYSFQGDYQRMWDYTVKALTEIADHNPANTDIAIEYKPDDPRGFAMMPNAATTLLAIQDVGRPNLGITIDFAHSLYAGEIPARAAYLVARHSRLLGVHLNDGYAKRDDGLMVGSIHPIQTVEFFMELIRQDYSGTIYFDTFPDQIGLDAVAEGASNIRMCEKFRKVALTLVNNPDLADEIANQDATRSLAIVTDALYRA